MEPILDGKVLYVSDDMAPEFVWGADSIVTDLIGYDTPQNNDLDEYGMEAIGRIHISNDRWDETERVIIRYKDKFYGSFYLSGLTESQDNYGYAETKTIDGHKYAVFNEVVPREVLVTKWDEA